MEVFAITELWDIILPLVDEVHLLRLQQVCRLFKNQINEDILSQQRLFLSASGPVIDNTPQRTIALDTDATNVKFNPLLTKISRAPFIDWSSFLSQGRTGESHWDGAGGSPHKVPKIQEWDTENHYLCIYSLTDGHVESRWNSMFITQPPITAVSLQLPQAKTLKEHGTGYPQDFDVRNPTGVSIGDIVREWKRVTKGNSYRSGAPLCIVLFAWATYERFYSTYRRVLIEYRSHCCTFSAHRDAR